MLINDAGLTAYSPGAGHHTTARAALRPLGSQNFTRPGAQDVFGVFSIAATRR
jgi:hypothetical protein